MKERIYEFNCSECGNTQLVKLSDFIQHIKDDRKDIAITFTRRCQKCNVELKFSMKMYLFVSAMKKFDIAEIERKINAEARTKGLREYHKKKRLENAK